MRSVSAIAVATCLAAPGVALAQVQTVSAPADSVSTQDPQSQDDSGAAEIIVTGVRASLDRAMEIKRDASGVVDAISAEDIGKFPDTNLAESLQRIPGVTIDRRNGEGSRVTVRGFGPTFNLVTLNGRQIATSDVNAVGGDQDVDFSRATSRSFDFSNLSSEGVRRLEVYKTGRAAIPSGGIGAAINIVTLRPLDGAEEGLRGSIGAKAVYDTARDFEDLTPELSGVVSWSDPNDTIGISLFGAYQKRNSAAASSTSNAWNVQPFSAMPGRGPDTVITNAPEDPNQLVAIPNDSRYHYSESSRERINGVATLQFRPVESLTITADAVYARNEVEEERMDQGNWFNRPFDNVTFDDNPIVATAIYLDEGDGYGVKDIGFEQQFRATKTELQSYGLNAEWEIADGFTLKLDGNHSTSASTPNARNGASSTLVGFGAPVVDGHSVDYSGDIPQQDWIFNDGTFTDGPDEIPGTADDVARGNGNGVLDIGDLGTQVQRTNASTQKHRVNQLRADLGWEFDGGGRFDIGTTYIDSKMTSQRVQTQQTLGDWGITQVGDVEEFAGGMIEQFCLECQFDHYNPTDAQIAFRGNAVDLYEAFAAAYSANPINVTGSDFDQVEEKIWSVYAQFTWNGEIMGREAGLVAGARFENTKVRSYAQFNQPDWIEWDSDNDFSRILRLVPETLVERSGEAEYSNLLPAIDFRISPMDDVVARVSYSKTMARPDYSNLFASEAANGPNRPIALDGVATGSTGNPGLRPLVSDNFDVSLEWYYGRSSYVSAGFFYKQVKNFIGAAQIDRNLFGLRDPSSGAPGSRSGTALEELNRIGAVLSDVSLFTMTALLVENDGDLAAASAEYRANIDPATGQIDQDFVDEVLARTDIIADADDPLFNFSVTTPINNREGNIHGFELQAQHFFGDTGFGVSGSFTKVYGDVGVDVGADPNENVFALVGLSDSFNITGIYENYGLSARVAYNWRDKFLAATNRGGSRNPVFYAPFGTLDVNISYDVTENIALSLEAINVLSEPIRTYGRDESNLFFAQELKPLFLFGARYRF
ncbi:TonB-dependent receptor [Sphingomonas gilva]|uniref:TonB-dependent receptor n=1 Tax=Sphingomonas gilva TaxID=2305907 RepID=UPI00319EA2A3